MGLFKSSGSGLSGLSVTNPRDLLQDLLKTASGASIERQVRYNIFNQIVAFKGVKEGIGCSTLVANTAISIARLGLTVCVLDTSMLCPCQDILLKTDFLDYRDKVGGDGKAHDWYEIGFSDRSVLNLSHINNRISVLSFQNRTYRDMAGTSDSTDLVELTLTQLQTKFDIILIDVSHEPTIISSACLQMAHKIIQVWSNGETCLRNVENFLTSLGTLSCSMDKMRYIVTSMTVDDVPTEWDELMKKYHFKHLAHVGMSMEIARISAQGQVLFNCPSRDRSIQDFNDCVTDITCHLLGIDANTQKLKSTYPAWDIEEGRNDGTLKEYYDNISDYPEVSQRAVDETDGVTSGENSYSSGIYSEKSDDTDSSEYGGNEFETDESLDLFSDDNSNNSSFNDSGIIEDTPSEKPKRSFFRRG